VFHVKHAEASPVGQSTRRSHARLAVCYIKLLAYRIPNSGPDPDVATKPRKAASRRGANTSRLLDRADWMALKNIGRAHPQDPEMSAARLSDGTSGRRLAISVRGLRRALLVERQHCFT